MCLLPFFCIIFVFILLLLPSSHSLGSLSCLSFSFASIQLFLIFFSLFFSSFSSFFLFLFLKLSGYAALKNNLFWLRALTCMFCFLSYVIMATVPNISFAYPYPSDAFLPNCSEGDINGYFDYRAYQIVLAVAVIIYAHSLVFTIYYVLPMDEENRKFIPG